MLQISQRSLDSRENCRVCYKNVFMLLVAVHNRQRVLRVFKLGSKRRQRDKMAGIPERCLESNGLNLCGQTIKEASEEAFVFLLSQKILDFLQG